MAGFPFSFRGPLTLLLSALSLVNSASRPDLPFIGCAAPEGNTQRCYFYVQEPKTWHEAENACRLHKGAYLATVPDYQTRIFLSEAARPRKNGVWIGGMKEAQHSWRTNTGRLYIHTVVENRTEPDAELCGYVNATNPTIIQTTPCTTKLKYICSESEMTSIHDPHYVSPERHWIWYSAKIDCLNRGMDLAVAKDDNLTIFDELLQMEHEKENDPRYWVGLSTSKYIWANNRKEMDHILFACGEPSHSTEKCIEMLADSKYSDTRCEEKRPYICEWVDEGHQMFDIGCLDTRCFYYVEEPMNWLDANRTCRHYSDTFLATIPDYHTQYYVNSMVTKLYLTKPKDQSAIMGRRDPIQNGCWIGGHSIFYDKWRFMNGVIYNGDVNLEDPFKDYHCGSVTPGDDAIHGLACDYRRRFLCLTTDPKADVLREENHFISSKQTQVLDWFKARTNCLDRGMELASGSMDLLQQILTGQTDSFWIGLTKSRYVWEHTRTPIDHLTFRCGEPNNYQGLSEHCVEMWLDGGYNDGLCTKEKPFVCEWDRQPVNPSSTKPPMFTLPKPKPTDHTWMHAAMAGYVGWFITILAFVICMFRSKTTLGHLPMPIYPIELENPDDPTLDHLLSPELKRILVVAAPDMHQHLPLNKDTRLWSILIAYNVVNQVDKEYIQGNNNGNINVQQVPALLEHLQRGPNRRYQYFRIALLRAGYEFVVRHYLDRAPGSPYSGAMVTPTPSCSSASAFPFPPPTAKPGLTQNGGGEEQPSSPSAFQRHQCRFHKPSGSGLSRFWKNFRHSFCPNLSSQTDERRAICEDTEDPGTEDHKIIHI